MLGQSPQCSHSFNDIITFLIIQSLPYGKVACNITQKVQMLYIPFIHLFSLPFIVALLENGFEEHKICHYLIIEHVTSAETIPVGHGLFYFTFSTWFGKQLATFGRYLCHTRPL